MAGAGTELRSLWVIGHRVTPIPAGARVAAFEVMTPPGIPGPPPHHHEDASEFFFVTAGRLGVMRDGAWTSMGPGGYAEVPRGAVHTFRNEADEELRFITGYEPMGFEGFFEEFGIEASTPGAFEASLSEETIRRVVEGFPRYGAILAPPVAAGR
jgi:mannose-6-phosphate isomerase-like protein (cupin superfamily)